MGFYFSEEQALALNLTICELSIAIWQGRLAFSSQWLREVGDVKQTIAGKVVLVTFDLGESGQGKLVQMAVLFRPSGITAEVNAVVNAPPWRQVTEWNLVGGGRSVTLPSSGKFPYSDVSFFV